MKRPTIVLGGMRRRPKSRNRYLSQKSNVQARIDRIQRELLRKRP